jgi:hypothetical protein
MNKYEYRLIKDYIESRQMEDGGYFFARVPPSSAMDTLYAVKSLRMLGTIPEKKDAVINYVRNSLMDASGINFNVFYAAVELMDGLIIRQLS